MLLSERIYSRTSYWTVTISALSFFADALWRTCTLSGVRNTCNYYTLRNNRFEIALITPGELDMYDDSSTNHCKNKPPTKRRERY